MSFEEKLWKHVDNKKLEHTDSSTELARQIIQEKRKEKIVEIAQKIIELKQIEADRNETDEFGDPSPNVKESAFDKMILEKKLELQTLEEQLKLSFDEEKSLKATDEIAFEDPVSPSLSQEN